MNLLNRDKLHIHIIILAAGFSSRYSTAENKLLKEINGKPMYRYAVDNAITISKKFANIDSVVFVTQYHEIMRELKKDENYISTIYNAHPERGISSSMKVGIAYTLKLKEGDMFEGEIRDLELSNENHAYLFMVADAPYINIITLTKFLRNFSKQKKGIGCFCYKNNLYNPVIFKEKYITELLELEGDKGGKQVVNKHIEDVFKYEVDEIEVKDIDYKELD